jgi:large subunit ribosomal protein L31e
VKEEEEEAVPEEKREDEAVAGAVEEEGAEAELEEAAEEKVEAEEKPLPAEIEEAKPPEKEKKEEEEEIVEERFYTIPLGKAWVRPPNKRAPRAMHLIRAFVTKHMKLAMRVAEEEEEKELPKLAISGEVNEKVWGRGIEKPPRKIRVRAAKDKDGNVTVYLAEGE